MFVHARTVAGAGTRVFARAHKGQTRTLTYSSGVSYFFFKASHWPALAASSVRRQGSPDSGRPSSAGF